MPHKIRWVLRPFQRIQSSCARDVCMPLSCKLCWSCLKLDQYVEKSAGDVRQLLPVRHQYSPRGHCLVVCVWSGAQQWMLRESMYGKMGRRRWERIFEHTFSWPHVLWMNSPHCTQSSNNQAVCTHYVADPVLSVGQLSLKSIGCRSSYTGSMASSVPVVARLLLNVSVFNNSHRSEIREDTNPSFLFN